MATPEERLRQLVVNRQIQEAWKADIHQSRLNEFNRKNQEELQIRELARRGARGEDSKKFDKRLDRLCKEIKESWQRNYVNSIMSELGILFHLFFLACKVMAKSNMVGGGVRLVFGADHNTLIDLLRMKLKPPPKEGEALPQLQFDIQMKDDGSLDGEGLSQSITGSNGEIISAPLKAKLQNTILRGTELWLESLNYTKNPAGDFVSQSGVKLTRDEFDALCMDHDKGIGHFFVEGFPMDIKMAPGSTPRMGG